MFEPDYQSVVEHSYQIVVIENKALYNVALSCDVSLEPSFLTPAPR